MKAKAATLKNQNKWIVVPPIISVHLASDTTRAKEYAEIASIAASRNKFVFLAIVNDDNRQCTLYRLCLASSHSKTQCPAISLQLRDQPINMRKANLL